MFEEFPKHLYQTPGQHAGNDGVTFDYIIVSSAEEEKAARAAGWQDFADAIAPKAEEPAPPASNVQAPPPGDDAPPTRAELEVKAKELGIEFSPNIGDKKLGERIQAALDAQKPPEA